MEADVDIVSCLYEFVRQLRTAARAENGACFAELGENRLIPPASVAELDNIASFRFKLAQNVSQSRRRVMEAGRQLEKEATHQRPEQVGDEAEIGDQLLRSMEAFHVCDQLTDFDTVQKFLLTGLPAPGVDSSHGGPGIKRGIQFDRLERARVMRK